jgi:hypothetical protein
MPGSRNPRALTSPIARFPAERGDNLAGFWLDSIRLQHSSGFNGPDIRRTQRMIEKHHSHAVEARIMPPAGGNARFAVHQSASGLFRQNPTTPLGTAKRVEPLEVVSSLYGHRGDCRGHLESIENAEECI